MKLLSQYPRAFFRSPMTLCTLFFFSLISLGSSQPAVAESPEKLKAFQRSFSHEYQQDYLSALQDLLPIQKRYPKNYAINLRLGWLYYQAGLAEKSRHFYQLSTQIMPKAIEPKLGLLLALQELKQFQQLIRIADQILLKDTHNYYANLRKLIALQHQAKYQQALQIAQQLLQLYPMDILFLEQAGLTSARLQLNQQAKAYFNQLRMLDPNNESAQAFFNKTTGVPSQ